MDERNAYREVPPAAVPAAPDAEDGLPPLAPPPPVGTELPPEEPAPWQPGPGGAEPTPEPPVRPAWDPSGDPDAEHRPTAPTRPPWEPEPSSVPQPWEAPASSPAPVAGRATVRPAQPPPAGEVPVQPVSAGTSRGGQCPPPGPPPPAMVLAPLPPPPPIPPGSAAPAAELPRRQPNATPDGFPPTPGGFGLTAAAPPPPPEPVVPAPVPPPPLVPAPALLPVPPPPASAPVPEIRNEPPYRPPRTGAESPWAAFAQPWLEPDVPAVPAPAAVPPPLPAPPPPPAPPQPPPPPVPEAPGRAAVARASVPTPAQPSVQEVAALLAQQAQQQEPRV